MGESSAAPVTRRRPNARGQGDRLRAEIITAAVQMLDELADDQALSLRAVARVVKIAATSVYLHFPDRDSLVLAATQRCHEELMRLGDEADAAEPDPGAGLRARTLAHARWAEAHPGLYKVLHESTVHRRIGMPFKEVMVKRTVESVQRCMDAGVAPVDDATTVAIDFRTAVNGMLSQRINEPDLPWPPITDQLDRFLVKLVGIDRSAIRGGGQ